MKLLIILFISIILVSCSSKNITSQHRTLASASDTVLECLLENNQMLVAKLASVSIGDKVYSKYSYTQKISRSSDLYTYNSNEFTTVVFKQFCGREGNMGVKYTNNSTKQTTELKCKNSNKCT